MNSIENKKIKYYLKLFKNPREKEKLLLFSDFFYKWNNNNDYQSRNKFNNYKYSTLSYDENEIFYNDYSDFIKEKMNYLQKNKLENLHKKLKINILDSQKKNIKLQLISMKLIFEPINSDKINIIDNDYNFEDYQEIYNYRNVETEEEENDEYINSNNIITFPLSYVFLFYSNEIDYFKDILLSSIKFSNDYKNVIFEENEIYTTLRREKDKKKIKMHKNLSNKIHQPKGSIKFNPKAFVFKKSTSKILNKLPINNVNHEFKYNPEIQDSNNVINNENINSLYKTNNKIITIHANPDLRKKEKNKNELYKKEIKYTEYIFIWETPNKTYRVRMIMPIILFWSEHIKKNIITYCDKNLFLFLFQNNFINWDYYILNYLFSIKAFRQIILSGLSFYRNYAINNIKMSSHYEREKKHICQINKKSDYSLFSYINEKTILLNENNESFKFFYTDIIIV